MQIILEKADRLLLDREPPVWRTACGAAHAVQQLGAHQLFFGVRSWGRRFLAQVQLSRCLVALTRCSPLGTSRNRHPLASPGFRAFWTWAPISGGRRMSTTTSNPALTKHSQRSIQYAPWTTVSANAERPSLRGEYS